MARTPDRAEMAIEFTEPIRTTKMIACSFSPNQSSASGSQVTLGSDWRPRTRLPSVSSTHFIVPMAIPMTSPTTIEIE